VLIDLREFSLNNLGAVKEIGLLAESSSFSKTLFVVENLEMQSKAGELIESLTGFQIGMEQIVCVATDDSQNLMQNMLDLRCLKGFRDYQYNQDAKTMDPHNQSELSLRRDNNSAYVYVLLIAILVIIIGSIVVWGLISKKFHRWIAENKDPLKSALARADEP